MKFQHYAVVYTSQVYFIKGLETRLEIIKLQVNSNSTKFDWGLIFSSIGSLLRILHHEYHACLLIFCSSIVNLVIYVVILFMRNMRVVVRVHI